MCPTLLFKHVITRLCNSLKSVHVTARHNTTQRRTKNIRIKFVFTIFISIFPIVTYISGQMNVLREASTEVCRIYDSKLHHIQWKWTALRVLGVLNSQKQTVYPVSKKPGYIFMFYTLVLKANNTCIGQVFGQSNLNSRVHPVESRALARQRKSGAWTLRHHDTSQHTASDVQTEWQPGSRETILKEESYEDNIVTATREGEAEEKERKRLQVQSRREAFKKERETCWGTTHIDIILYVQSCDSLQAEEKDGG